MGDWVFSAGFWPKPKPPPEEVLVPNENGAAGLGSGLGSVFAPKENGDAAGWLGCPNGEMPDEPLGAPNVNPVDGFGCS